MKPESRLLKALVRLLLRLFPEDVQGITRSEMEETFYDRCRAQGRPPFLFIVRELWCLTRHGLHDRFRSA